MRDSRMSMQGAVTAILLVLFLLPACKSAKAPEKESAKNKVPECCDCPETAGSRIPGWFRVELLPREWTEQEKQAAVKSLRNYRLGQASMHGDTMLCCQFQITDELLIRLLAAKEAQARQDGFAFHRVTPDIEWQKHWFGDFAAGTYKTADNPEEMCRHAWWVAGKHPADFFWFWNKGQHPGPHESLAMKVGQAKHGMRWVFIRYWNE